MNAKEQFIQESLKDGEQYAGIILGKEGEPDHHLILLPGEADSVNWEDAKKWAAQIDGELPTRREQSLLFANLKEQFKSNWYWSNTQHAAGSGYAWVQDFDDGGQGHLYKSVVLRVRVVRRLIIQYI